MEGLATNTADGTEPSTSVASLSSDEDSGVTGTILIIAGLVAGIIVVLGTVAICVMLLVYHRNKVRRRERDARERARQQNAELPEGDPGPVRIPIIVVLPDNKLHFAWEVPVGDGGAGCSGLERAVSDSIKSSLGEDEEPDQEEGTSTSGGPGAPHPERARRPCRPPFTAVHVHVVDENY